MKRFKYRPKRQSGLLTGRAWGLVSMALVKIVRGEMLGWHGMVWDLLGGETERRC